MGRPLAVLAASALAATTGMGPSSSSFPSVAVAFPVETSQVTSFRHYTRSSRLHDTITPVSAATESNPSMSCYPSGHLNARRHSTTSSSMMTITSRSSPARPTGSSGFLASKMTRAAPGSVWIGGRTGIAKAEALTRTGDGRATGAGRWSMTSYDNYARDYLGPRLWPKPPLKPLSGESWNRCDEMVELGSSGLMVSKVGVGCIAFGGQVEDPDDVADILNHAFDNAGINWLDTSETYPHPLIPEHKFKADPPIGQWLQTRDRSKVIVSTKVAGHAEQCTWLRKDGSHLKINRDQILESVEGSLKRLGTDYIDILHLGDWPERLSTGYGQESWPFEDEHEPASDIEEQLMVAQELIDQGMVRHVAVANENAFGVTKFCEHAIWDDLPKITSVQTQYNLLTQSRVERGLLETCCKTKEDVSIIATMPLGGGAFTGKYMYERPELRNMRWRLNKYPGYQTRFNNSRVDKIYEQYIAIASRYGMTLREMSLAWVFSRPSISAVVMGVTSEAQIEANLASLKIKLPQECLDDITRVQDSVIEPTIGRVDVKEQHNYRETPGVALAYGDVKPNEFFGSVTDPVPREDPDYPRSYGDYIKEDPENIKAVPDTNPDYDLPPEMQFDSGLTVP